MVKHFTIADWGMTVDTPGGQRRGFQLMFHDNPVPDDVMIQVFERLSDTEFAPVMLKMNFGITVFRNSILIFGDQPFNGKVVLK